MPTATSGRDDRDRDPRAAELPSDELDVDAADDDLAGDDLADGDDLAGAGSGVTLTKTRPRTSSRADVEERVATGRRKTGRTRARRERDERSANPFVALVRFISQVVAEMRKVLWPTRRELVVYTIAVIIFVSVLIAIVGGLDFGFARLVLLVFG